MRMDFGIKKVSWMTVLEINDILVVDERGDEVAA